MPTFPVTVTASYVAADAPEDTVKRLSLWAEARDGRTFIVDRSIAPVRWTITVDYLIDADGDVAAERLATERYTEEAHRERFPEAETVIAATGSLT